MIEEEDYVGSVEVDPNDEIITQICSPPIFTEREMADK
jgi:hypothetical protein